MPATAHISAGKRSRWFAIEAPPVTFCSGKRVVELEAGEEQRWKEIVQRLEEGGNEGADVYDAEAFIRAMEEKYQTQWQNLEP